MPQFNKQSKSPRVLATSQGFSLVHRKTSKGNLLCLFGPDGNPVKASKIPGKLFTYLNAGADSLVYRFGDNKVLKFYYRAVLIEHERNVNCFESVKKLVKYKEIVERMVETAKHEIYTPEYDFPEYVQLKVMSIDIVCTGLDKETGIFLRDEAAGGLFTLRDFPSSYMSKIPIVVQEYVDAPHPNNEEYILSGYFLFKKLNQFVRSQFYDLYENGTFTYYDLEFCNVRVVRDKGVLNVIITDPLTVVLDIPPKSFSNQIIKN